MLVYYGFENKPIPNVPNLAIINDDTFDVDAVPLNPLIIKINIFSITSMI